MQTRTEYLEFAQECDRLAKEIKAEGHRMALKEMAEAWREISCRASDSGNIAKLGASQHTE